VRITDAPLEGIKLIEPTRFSDRRGWLEEVWNARWFEQAGIAAAFVQDNHSLSAKGVLRGLHYQVQSPQAKLIRVLAGRIFDVAVDLRRSSPTFGHWFGVELSAASRRMMWIPTGFAHGFLSLAEGSEVFYKCTDFYAPSRQRSLLWSDPAIGINWPLGEVGSPILSEIDERAPHLAEAESFD
jgi:dTDP-4-dehydrorhamnose 3,5-epimerase